MQKLKIAHLICDLGPGGGQKSTIDLIRATNEDFENHLILLENIRNYEPEGISLSYVCNNKKIFKKLNKLGDWLLSKKLEKILKEKNIDIIISHMEVTAKVVRFLKTPKIYYMRTDTIQELEGLKERSFNRYKRRKNLYKKIFTNQNLITVSKETKEKLERFFTFSNIESIYNPFDIENIRKLSKENVLLPKDEYIIQIGSGFDVKGQDILIRAFSKILNKKIKLLLLGTSEYNDLKILIEKYNLKDRVLFINYVKNPYPYIKNAKLLVLSSRREGLPRVLVESFILKTPVVSTNCETGPKEILEDEFNVYLSEVENFDQMAKNIDKALLNYPIISDYFIKKFDKNVIRKKYKKFVNKINY